ncbi:MAG: cyclic nucleotide-binding domain-containing protein [Gaiellaceae bacterium]
MTLQELREIPLFDGLSEAGLERLAACAAEIQCEPGQILALEGDPGSGMFIVLDGTVSVEMRGGWHTELGEGTFVGEVALLVPGATRVARVRAATDVRCLTVPRPEFLELVESEPSLALKMLRELARRLSNA